MALFRDDLTIVLAGEAGQGIQTIETLLVRLLKGEGYHVFATKEYMSRVRGGINSTTLRIAARRVCALREKIDILIPLHKDALPHLNERLSEESVVIGEKETLGQAPTIDVAFTAMATALGNAVYANIIAVGLIAGLLNIDKDRCAAFIAGYFGRKDEEIKAKNVTAVQNGYAIGRQLVPQLTIEIGKDPGVAGEIMLTGAEAVALGALAGGCNYLCGYPMSPATGVLTNMAAYAPHCDVVVEQVEDEIGVVNMAIGASYAGARAMVTTSGGGFALMTEGLSLAGMIETPLVIHLGQRPGPATGLPTRTEQGDLHHVLYASHGAFPRIILAPGSIAEAFSLSQQAFNLADKFQVPVFILTDQYLMDTYYNMPLWDMENLRVEKYFLETEETYRRFRFTETGLSPRGLPGFGKGIVCVDSDEHDEGGYITEDFDLRKKMVEKRLRKYDAIKADVMPPIFSGPERPATLIVGWGSTYHAIAEAVQRIGRKDIAHLHFSWLHPLPESTAAYLEKAEKIIVVEGNATGQFRQLLQLQSGSRTMQGLLKYNGLPFSVEELVKEVEK